MENKKILCEMDSVLKPLLYLSAKCCSAKIDEDTKIQSLASIKFLTQKNSKGLEHLRWA